MSHEGRGLYVNVFWDTESIAIANFYPKTIIWTILATLMLECGSIRLSKRALFSSQGPGSYQALRWPYVALRESYWLLSSERVQSGPLGRFYAPGGYYYYAMLQSTMPSEGRSQTLRESRGTAKVSEGATRLSAGPTMPSEGITMHAEHGT